MDYGLSSRICTTWADAKSGVDGMMASGGVIFFRMVVAVVKRIPSGGVKLRVLGLFAVPCIGQGVAFVS